MLDRLAEIHKRFGLYSEGLVSVVKQGRNGSQEIADLMTGYRINAPSDILGEKVVVIRDFLSGVSGFPKSNVLQFITEAGSRITVRPSGTEPKIKYYVSVKSDLKEGDDYSEKRSELQQKVKDLFAAFGA
jgi:phosphoglucomutase